MNLAHALLLGAVQGLTEFFPVSSSGHLLLVPWLAHWTYLIAHPALDKTFDVALHVGTLVGALVYFRKDVARYLTALVRSIRARWGPRSGFQSGFQSGAQSGPRVGSVDERLAWLLVLASVPGAIAGAIVEQFVDTHLGKPAIIAVWLAVFGVVLFVVDRRARGAREMGTMGVADALWMGAAQVLALSPGVSRSGITITAARARGLGREAAVRFSFLMSLVIIGGAGVYKGLGVVAHGLPPGFAVPFLAGMAAAAVTGTAAIAVTLRLVQRHSFGVFAAYRVVAALGILGLLVTGVR
jgi:undecaprenyl-diphosphatase